MLVIKEFSFRYPGSEKLFDNIGLKIENKEKVALIGANGAGKSTLIKLILGLLNGDGEILVDDLKLQPDTLGEIRKKIGYVLQNSDDQMFMPTVIEDMIFGPMNYGMDRDSAISKAEMILDNLDINNLRNAYNHKISGGQKRMAAIATILMMDPEIIIMDEPSASLDPKNRRKIINTLKSLDNSLIIATHDLDMVLDVCERVVLINKGKIVADGKTEDILYDKKLLEENNLELPLSFINR